MLHRLYWYLIDGSVSFLIAVTFVFLCTNRKMGERMNWQAVIIVWVTVGVLGIIGLYANGTLHDVDEFAAPLTP